MTFQWMHAHPVPCSDIVNTLPALIWSITLYQRSQCSKQPVGALPVGGPAPEPPLGLTLSAQSHTYSLLGLTEQTVKPTTVKISLGVEVVKVMLVKYIAADHFIRVDGSMT